MSALLSILLLATLPGDAGPAVLAGPADATLSGGASATERIELRKDGGPGHGPDQPYAIREQGARDLERFIGGKQVVFVAPLDVFLLLLLVVLIVVLIIVL
jgi:hypothetical protein